MSNNAKHIEYSFADIERYVKGKMSADEMHLLEKAALQDPFLADALEGFAAADFKDAKNNLNSIEAKILQQKIETKVVPFATSTHKKQYWVAAACIGIVGIGLFYVLNPSSKQNNTIAKNTTIEKLSSETQKQGPAKTYAADSVAAITQPIQQTNTASGSATQGTTQQWANSNGNYVSTNNYTATAIATDTIKLNAADDKEMSAGLVSSNKISEKKDIEKDGIENRRDNALTKKQEDAKNYFYNNASDESKMKRENASMAAAPAPNNNFNSNIISGRVLNNANEPVGFATIQVPDTKYNFSTDANGVFNIPAGKLNDTAVRAVVNSVGYETNAVTLNSNRQNTVVLNSNNLSLSEVVVTGLGKPRPKKANSLIQKLDTVVTPVGGWDAFHEYLSSINKKISVDTTFADFKTTRAGNSLQEVVLEFKVDENGTPKDITVKQPATNNEKNNLAIEALKNGPKWVAPKKKAKGKVAIKL